MYMFGKNLKNNKCIMYVFDDNGRPRYCSILNQKLKHTFGIYKQKNQKDKFILNCF